MSEYQYYEWQTLERPLTTDEQKAVNSLSSHIDVTSSQAIVTYEWSNFKHDSIQVLAKYFDSFLYMADWGTRRLAFRFPKGLVDEAALAPYCDKYHLTFKDSGKVQILEFNVDEEEGFEDWMDTRGVLSTLSRLRDDILQGDFRALYLAWLKAMSMESDDNEEDEDDPESLSSDPEPPLPAGLRQLTPPLKELIDFFEIDDHLVAAAAQRSPDLSPASQVDYARLIRRLSRPECDDFLLKFANNENGTTAALRKNLLGFEKVEPAALNQPRTFGELLKAAGELEMAEKRRQAEKRRKAHVAEMQNLAKRETQTWQEIETLLQGRTTKAYNEATALLEKLQQLAEFQDTQVLFQQQIHSLAERFKGRTSLIARWKAKGWV